MKADAAAVLSWLRTSELWTLLDQMVTPLLGRSPLQITFAACSGVIELPDDELEVLVELGLVHLDHYYRPSAGPTRPLDDDELDALAAFRGVIARAWGGS